MLPCLSLLCFAVFGPPGLALESPVPTAVHPSAASVQAYGRANPACGTWTDGCVACQAGPGGGPASCSTPGIACTPGPVACRGP